MAASANALNPRLIDRKFYIAAAIGFPLIDSSVARYPGSFIFAPPRLTPGALCCRSHTRAKTNLGRERTIPRPLFLSCRKATNPKTHRIKGDDDRHLKLNCSPKLEMVLGFPAAAADCS